MRRAPHIGTRNRIATVGAKLLLIFLDPMTSSLNVKLKPLLTLVTLGQSLEQGGYVYFVSLDNLS
jgi:hypothetical protein